MWSRWPCTRHGKGTTDTRGWRTVGAHGAARETALPRHTNRLHYEGSAVRRRLRSFWRKHPVGFGAEHSEALTNGERHRSISSFSKVDLLELTPPR